MVSLTKSNNDSLAAILSMVLLVVISWRVGDFPVFILSSMLADHPATMVMYLILSLVCWIEFAGTLGVFFSDVISKWLEKRRVEAVYKLSQEIGQFIKEREARLNQNADLNRLLTMALRRK